MLAVALTALIMTNRNASREEGGEAILSWNANKETDVIGYRVYYGTEKRTGECPLGGYADKIDVGNRTTHTVTNLEKGKRYYFSTTSYNKGGKESCFSQEVSKEIK
ncbi:MAG: Fibronectin, type III domain protein [Candidatus Wolfebacteria bacterium GW2011_GWC1_47_103]|nr:MAG: Fibronectin, type III domain protein [Candidatus Wolfebacteria bacterium GW2011_GWC1_47_103]